MRAVGMILAGGTNHKSNPTTFNPSFAPIKLYTPTKDGYVFKGWSLNGNIVVEIPVGTEEDITLTALWEEEIIEETVVEEVKPVEPTPITITEAIIYYFKDCLTFI